MAFKVLQNTKINNKDFIFSNPETVNYPIAPLVSAEFYTPEGGKLTLKIRATLYINSDNNKEPNVKEPVETGNLLKVVFKSDFAEGTPESCDVWYVEVDYTSDSVDNITEVVSYLKKKNNDIDLDDPITSRGTEIKVKI